jgi:adenosylcobinamide-GDP ribazoletransferase
MGRLAEEWVIFLLAMQFLTRLPVGEDPGWTPERMEATPRWYPAVGMVVGIIAAAVFWLAALFFPPLVSILLSTASGVLVTGAFHEDGFTDCCDGLGGAVDRDRALEIMKDSRLGTYGAVGLALLFGVKVASLVSLPTSAVPAVLIAGHTISRASAVAVIATSTYLRDHGTGKPVASGSAGWPVAALTSFLALLLLAALLPPAALLTGVLGLVLGHLLMRRVFEPRLGGYTGDCLGAVQQTSETGLIMGILVGLSGAIA